MEEGKSSLRVILCFTYFLLPPITSSSASYPTLSLSLPAILYCCLNSKPSPPVNYIHHRMLSLASQAHQNTTAAAQPTTSQAHSQDDILSGIPSTAPTWPWSNFRTLTSCVEEVHRILLQAGEDGNQYVIVLNISKYAVSKLLDEDETLGPIEYRFMHVGTVGVIKVIPSGAHDVTVGNFASEIEWQLRGMGVSRAAFQFGRTTTHPAVTSDKSKQPDDCIFPGPRKMVNAQIVAWPTFVVEAGVSESLPRLREDASWWFANSAGMVRIVLLLAIRKRTKTIVIERWQLAPPGTPRLNSTIISNLRQQSTLPPQALQSVVTQQPFAMQELTVTPTSTSGSPLVIPLMGIMDRAPMPGEGDVVFTGQQLMECCAHL